MEKPYIAAVNGAAVGAGMDMASMCDIRFAAETARFGMTYVRMGIIPGDGGAYYLPRLVGTARALDLIWTGRVFDAKEALEMGYVTAVVPDDDLMNYTREYAAAARAAAPPSRCSSRSDSSTVRPTPASTPRSTSRPRRCTSPRAPKTPAKAPAPSPKSANPSSKAAST